MSRALRIRPMCLAYQKWCPAWRQNKTCESFARRVSRIYRATSNRADYRIIINWNVTSGQRVILLYIIFIYFVIIWLHLIFTLPLPRTLVHCQLLIGMQTAVNIVGKVARICAMFWFMIMQNESRSQGLSNHWFIVWSPYFFFFEFLHWFAFEHRTILKINRQTNMPIHWSLRPEGSDGREKHSWKPWPPETKLELYTYYLTIYDC